MAPKRTDDLALMQHVDGELDERAEAAFAAAIDGDLEAAATLDSLAQMSELVRGHLELSADAVPDHKFAAMWREVSKAVDEAAVPAGFWGSITTWFERHRGHVITGAVSAGAVAALALVLRPGSHDPGSKVPSSAIDVRPVSMRSPPAIESLDTPDGTGTVLNLEDEDGHTAVIWVTPADSVEGI